MQAAMLWITVVDWIHCKWLVYICIIIPTLYLIDNWDCVGIIELELIRCPNCSASGVIG